MPNAAVNDIELYYEVRGEGEPLLLIAGIGQDHNTFAMVAERLSDHVELILPDNRGVGQSDMPDMPYTVELMASDFLALLDELDIDSAHVAGHSLGAAIAFEMARVRPQRVRKLVLMSGLYPGPDVVMPSPEALEVLTDRSGEPEELVKRGIRIAAAPGFEEREPEFFQILVNAGLNRTQPPKIYARQSTAGALYVQEDHLGDGLEPDLLLIYGEHDQVAPPENGERIRDEVSEAEIVVIPDAGHLVHVEQPAAVAEAIIDFLEE